MAGLLVLTEGACAGLAVDEREFLRRNCGAGAPAGSRSFATDSAADLAGTYELRLIQTGGTRDDDTGPYRLVLWANDSLRRYGPARQMRDGRWRGQRPLAGQLSGANLPEGSVLASNDPDRPGATLIDSLLTLGPVDVFDGGGDRLVIESVSPVGFWGSWRRDRGIQLDPEPTHGTFCAARTAPR